MAKFPIGSHMILQLQIKEFKTWLNQVPKNYLNQKSAEVQLLEIILNWLCFQSYGNTYAVNGRLSQMLPAGVATLNWAITTPLLLSTLSGTAPCISLSSMASECVWIAICTLRKSIKLASFLNKNHHAKHQSSITSHKFYNHAIEQAIYLV